jgi:hypothetical protein
VVDQLSASKTKTFTQRTHLFYVRCSFWSLSGLCLGRGNGGIISGFPSEISSTLLYLCHSVTLSVSRRLWMSIILVTLNRWTSVIPRVSRVCGSLAKSHLFMLNLSSLISV